MNVETADGAQQRVGRNHAVTLALNEPGAGVGQILLRIEHIDRGALSAGGLTPERPGGDAGRAHFNALGRAVSATLRTFIAHPARWGVRRFRVWFHDSAPTPGGSVTTVPWLPDLRRRGTAVVNRHVELPITEPDRWRMCSASDPTGPTADRLPLNRQGRQPDAARQR